MADSKVKIVFTTDDSALEKSQKNAIAGAQTTSKEINKAYQERYDKQKQTAQAWEQYEKDQNKGRVANEKQTQKEIEAAQKAKLAEMLAAQRSYIKEIDNARKQSYQEELDRQKEQNRQLETNAKEALRIVNNRIREEERTNKKGGFKSSFTAGAAGGAVVGAIQNAIPYIGGILQKGQEAAEVDYKIADALGGMNAKYYETIKALDQVSEKYHLTRDDLAEQALAYIRLAGSSGKSGVMDDMHGKLISIVGITQSLNKEIGDPLPAQIFVKSITGGSRGLSMYYSDLKGVTDQTQALNVIHNHALAGLRELWKEANDPMLAYRHNQVDLKNDMDKMAKSVNTELIPAFKDFGEVLHELAPLAQALVVILKPIEWLMDAGKTLGGGTYASMQGVPVSFAYDYAAKAAFSGDSNDYKKFIERLVPPSDRIPSDIHRDFDQYIQHAEGMVINSPLYSKDKYGRGHVQGEAGTELLVPERKISPKMARYLKSVILSKNGDPSEEEITEFEKETGIHHALDFIAEHGLEAAEHALQGAGYEGLADVAGTAAGSIGPLGVLYMAYNAVKNHDKHAMEYLAGHILHGTGSTAVSIPIPQGVRAPYYAGEKIFGNNAFASQFLGMTGHADGAVIGGDDADFTPADSGVLPADAKAAKKAASAAAKKRAARAKEEADYQLSIQRGIAEYYKQQANAAIPFPEDISTGLKITAKKGVTDEFTSNFKSPLFANPGMDKEHQLQYLHSIVDPDIESAREGMRETRKEQEEEAARHLKDNTKETKNLTETMREFLSIAKEGKSLADSFVHNTTRNAISGGPYGASVDANGMLAWQQPRRKNSVLHDIIGGIGKAASLASKIPGLDKTNPLLAKWLDFGGEGLQGLDDSIPSFAEGGRANFGNGTLTVLHGWENIVPDSRMPEVAAKFNSSSAGAENTAALNRIEKAIRSQRLVMQSDAYGNSLSQDSALAKNGMDKF